MTLNTVKSYVDKFKLILQQNTVVVISCIYQDLPEQGLQSEKQINNIKSLKNCA